MFPPPYGLAAACGRHAPPRDRVPGPQAAARDTPSVPLDSAGRRRLAGAGSPGRPPLAIAARHAAASADLPEIGDVAAPLVRAVTPPVLAVLSWRTAGRATETAAGTSSWRPRRAYYDRGCDAQVGTETARPHGLLDQLVVDAAQQAAAPACRPSRPTEQKRRGSAEMQNATGARLVDHDLRAPGCRAPTARSSTAEPGAVRASTSATPTRAQARPRTARHSSSAGRTCEARRAPGLVRWHAAVARRRCRRRSSDPLRRRRPPRTSAAAMASRSATQAIRTGSSLSSARPRPPAPRSPTLIRHACAAPDALAGRTAPRRPVTPGASAPVSRARSATARRTSRPPRPARRASPAR